jgi:cysteine desulfurase / selenocysteine lyase
LELGGFAGISSPQPSHRQNPHRHRKPDAIRRRLMLPKETQSLFPIKRKRAYLNNASIAPMSLPVIEAVDAFMADVRDNGRNNYPQWCRRADNEMKQRIAELIGADKTEIAYVKNTTEGLGIVANGLDWREGDNVIVADIEYPSNVYCWMNLKERGVELRWLKNRSGRVGVTDLAAAIDRRTRLVSLSAVQFSNGFRQDLASTGELCRSKGVLLNLDAIQWIGALHMDLSRYHIDFLSAGGHKWMLAPIGTGLFYCRHESLNSLRPPTVGYHSVDKHEDHMDYDLTFRPNAGRFEEALINFPGICGLDAAVKLMLAIDTRLIERHVRALTDYAREECERRGFEILSPGGEDERSGILSFRSPNVSAELLVQRLFDAKVDVAVRAGAIRISPTIYNDEEDIRALLEALR